MSMALRLKPQGTRLTALLVGATLLAGCQDGSLPSFLQSAPDSEVATRANTTPTTKLVERDVEAPDVFQVTESGLWDGRPSLGGVWVAHPNVTDPERVIIRNASNNQFVIGALFRREREIPGPRIQVSSDAAEALGLLAGAPVQLDVTALRSEAVAPDPVDEPVVAEAAPVAESLPAAASVQASALPATKPVSDDPTIALAAAALADVDTQPLPQPKRTQPKPAEINAEAEAEIDLAAADVEAEAKPAKKPFAWPWARKQQELSEPPLSEVAAVTAVAATTTTPLPPAPRPVAKPASKPRSKLDKPFIQIGIFSVETNADSAAAQMRRAGMLPTIYDQTSNGKRFWRVVVGPASSSSERTTLLKKVKSTGFSDAYTVSN